MNLAEKIQKDLVDAMRAKEELRLSVLRGIKAAIKHKEVEKIRPLDEAEAIQILQMLVKQRKESIDHFAKGKMVDRLFALTILPKATDPNSSPRKRKSSPSSNRICPPAPAKPKWTRPSPKQSPNPARLRSSRWAPLLKLPRLRWKARLLTANCLAIACATVSRKWAENSHTL